MNKNSRDQRIAITAGDYNGIGPEIIVKALKKLDLPREKVVLIGAKPLFEALKGRYEIVEIPFDEALVSHGVETQEAGEFSYQCLLQACEMARKAEISAIVTAPVSKNALHLAGHNFSGQTEVLENEQTGTAEMLFVAGDFRVLLLTRHVALKDVKITKDLLVQKLTLIDEVLRNDFGLDSPKIALCALNPHAGENGILGTEELDEFLPAVEILRAKGVDVTPPMSADTLFVKAAKTFNSGVKQPYDCYASCYHDQGLIPMKVLAMDSTVNMTVGLDILRTSPAHGTAYDLAGKNLADESSMIEAIRQALRGS